MGALLERIHNEAVLWIDDTAYSALLLAAGQPPWTDAPGLVAWRGKSQRLLKSDVVSLDLDALSRAWIVASADLREMMTEKKRPVAPLRTLLAYEPLRRVVVEALMGLASDCAGQLLALKLPSPRQWLEFAYRIVHGDLPVYDDDDVDRAALYMADFIRTFATCGVHAVLLDSTGVGEPVAAAEMEFYATIANAAHHYRWDLGILSDTGNMESLGGATGVFDFVVSPEIARGTWGKLVRLNGTDDAARFNERPANLLYAILDENAQPEAILTQLAALRTAGRQAQ